MPDQLTRRALVQTGAAFAAAQVARAQIRLTAGDVIARIKKNVGIPWRGTTVDHLIAGNLETPVQGIATTMMATLDVVKRAAAAGKNMVITHESTFFSHQDSTDQISHDETYLFKLDFLRRHDMAVFHFHDHWHHGQTDGIAVGMAKELGWEKRAARDNPREFVFAGMPLERLAREIQSKLRIRTMRVVGDPKLAVNRALASWGNVSLMPGIPYLARPDVDALIIGETREWELVEYAQDAIASGKKKALVILGHVVSEQSGMKYCAEWLKGFVSEVPIEFVPAAEPFWRPDAPVG